MLVFVYWREHDEELLHDVGFSRQFGAHIRWDKQLEYQVLRNSLLWSNTPALLAYESQGVAVPVVTPLASALPRLHVDSF